MIISRTMNLDDLAQRLGDCADYGDAMQMRGLLVESHYGEDTEDLENDEWLRLVEQIEFADKL